MSSPLGLGKPADQIRLSWFWRGFLVFGILFNFFAGVRMLADQPALLGDLASAGAPSLFLSVLGFLLLTFAAMTALILADAPRYWPLAWFAAFGRIAAGATMLYYASQGLVPIRILVPGIVDSVLGLGFLFFAFRYYKRR